MKTWKLAAGLLLSVALPSVALATELEVTHWWTSGGEAAAVAELAKAFDASGDRWVDGAIAGGGDTLAAIDKYAVADKMGYISTGGGAFLEFVEGKTLPAVAVLLERAQ